VCEFVAYIEVAKQAYPHIPRFSYNLQPPTASSDVTVDSIIVDDAGAGDF
jgi:hypothetical protein